MNVRSGKCPGCGLVVQRVTLQSMDIGQPFGTTYAGVSYVCPNLQCQTILGVGLDPVALKTDTINGVVKALRGKV